MTSLVGFLRALVARRAQMVAVLAEAFRLVVTCVPSFSGALSWLAWAAATSPPIPARTVVRISALRIVSLLCSSRPIIRPSQVESMAQGR
jgi:hypothetical protein